MNKTVLHPWHTDAGAKMHEFGSFDMPIQYSAIFAEHLATRTGAGLFDISHMGRYVITGKDAVSFLQYVLTSNVLELREAGLAQYCVIPDESGAAIDDAYLYRTSPEEYMLVVNAGNRDKDWQWLIDHQSRFGEANIEDRSESLSMLALQGPTAELILQELIGQETNGGQLPEPMRNAMSSIRFEGVDLLIARTGYTGEPVAFELFPPTSQALSLWERILEVGSGHGIAPVGLGARDTLRLEAGLPLYGHELGDGPDGKPIPIFSLLSLANSATSFSAAKGDYVGRDALQKQHSEVRERLRLLSRKFTCTGRLQAGSRAAPPFLTASSKEKAFTQRWEKMRTVEPSRLDISIPILSWDAPDSSWKSPNRKDVRSRPWWSPQICDLPRPTLAPSSTPTPGELLPPYPQTLTLPYWPSNLPGRRPTTISSVSPGQSILYLRNRLPLSSSAF